MCTSNAGHISYSVVPCLSQTNRVQVCLSSICMRDMCFPCQDFLYHPAVATCQIQIIVSTMLSPCSYHRSFVLVSSLLTCWAHGCWLCDVPTLVVIFSGSFLGTISAKYTLLGIKVVLWLLSWPEMNDIHIQVSGLPEYEWSAFGYQSKSYPRELERS